MALISYAYNNSIDELSRQTFYTDIYKEHHLAKLLVMEAQKYVLHNGVKETLVEPWSS